MATESDPLIEFLRNNPSAEKFVPYCHRHLGSDVLTVYFEGDPDYSERLSEHVTLYRSLETNEIVGCRIKGIAGILEDLPNFLRVKHDGVDLSVLFFAFRGGVDKATGETLSQLAKATTEKGMTLAGMACGT